MVEVKFSREEVIGYLEELYKSNEANTDEMELYENYVWNGQLNKLYKYTYINLVKKMKAEYEG